VRAVSAPCCRESGEIHFARAHGRDGGEWSVGVGRSSHFAGQPCGRLTPFAKHIDGNVGISDADKLIDRGRARRCGEIVRLNR